MLNFSSHPPPEQASFPLVSVIMPAYNAAPYIDAAITSILQQHYQQFELIIINDGSTDATPERILKHHDHRIRYVDQPNAGLPATLNRGILLAKGQYIARMDADDVAHPQRLSQQVAHMEQNPHLVLLGCTELRIDEHDQPVEMCETLVDDMQLRRQLFVGTPFAHSSAMFRRSLLERVGTYKNINSIEDFDLWVRFAQAGEIATLPHAYISIRIHNQSLRARHQVRDRDAKAAYLEALWQEAQPPVPWGPSRSLYQRLRFLRAQSRLLQPDSVHHSGLRYRSRRKLYTWVGLEIAHRFMRQRRVRRGWGEWLALLCVNAAHPLELARCLKQVPALLRASKS